MIKRALRLKKFTRWLIDDNRVSFIFLLVQLLERRFDVGFVIACFHQLLGDLRARVDVSILTDILDNLILHDHDLISKLGHIPAMVRETLFMRWRSPHLTLLHNYEG